MELDRIIQNLSDDKTELEEAHLRVRAEKRELEEKVDTATARADHLKKLEETLRNSTNEKLSSQFMKMSEEFQQIRLGEFRHKRAINELEERVTYLSRLLKSKNEAVAELEERAASMEGQMRQEQERFRRQENERNRKFFYESRFEGPTDPS